MCDDIDLNSFFTDPEILRVRRICLALGLRPYQTEGIECTDAGWREADVKAQLLCMATGLGKTPTMAALARIEIERGGRVLVLAHTDELIDQALDKISRFGQIKAAKEKASNYAGRFTKCVVGSVQTMSGELRLKMWPADHFTLVLVDEAHRSPAASYQKILTKFQGGGARVIGVTATADRGDKKSLGEYFQKIAFDYGLLQGVRDGWLVRPLVKTMPLTIDINGVKSKTTAAGSDLDQTEVAKRLIPFLGAIAEQVKTAVPNGTFMFFMPSVETAKLMSDALNSIGLSSEWISGDRDERRQIVADFKKGKYRAICNMAVLTEGFDHDKVDTIVCLRPTKIRSLFVQIVGRACRPLNEIVPLLGKANNALERLAIIKASAKPAYQILDFLWLYEKHDLVIPASLVTQSEEVKKAMSGKDGDLIEAEQQAERDVLAALEKAVRRNENKKGRTIDPLAVAAELHDVTLANYEPATANDALPATDQQLATLTKIGIDTENIKLRGHATALISKVVRRNQEGLATIRQMHFLWDKLGIDASAMKMGEAGSLIDKQKQRWIDKANAAKSAKAAEAANVNLKNNSQLDLRTSAHCIHIAAPEDIGL